MKFLSSIMLPAAICMSLTACSGHNHDEHGHGVETAELSKEEDHDHEIDEIIVKPETATRFGIETDTVTSSAGLRTIKVTGQIITEADQSAVISAPTSGIVHFRKGISEGKNVASGTGIASISAQGISGGDSNKAAKARLDAARREMELITPLHDEGIVSTRDFNAAKRAYEEARAEYSQAADNGTAISPISGTITSVLVANGQYVNAGDGIATVSANSGLILRADLPEKYYSLLADIYDANVQLPYSDGIITLSEIGGKRMTTPAAASANRPGYIPVVFSFNNKSGSTIAGTSAEVYLKISGVRDSVCITIPTSALSEQQGNFFVYVKTGDHSYRKTLVGTDGSDGKNVNIRSGLNQGDRIVVKGTSVVRMAETSGIVPEGHHHH